jgi:hypothetical protein
MGLVTSDLLIGVDIGQRHDPTAICVTEAVEDDDTGERSYTVRSIRALPLGTKYPDVAAHIVGVVLKLHALSPDLDPWLLMDATGVGLPVVDTVRDALDAVNLSCRLTACFFTHGDHCDWESGSREAKVGKAFLVSRLQALLQQGRLRLPRTRESEALATELLDYEIRVNENANMIAGAFRTGAHDDLVTAVGLTVITDRGRASGRVAFASTHMSQSLTDAIRSHADRRALGELVRQPAETPTGDAHPTQPTQAPDDTYNVFHDDGETHEARIARTLRQLMNLDPLGGW